MAKSSPQADWPKLLLVLIAGGVQPLAFAPFSLYPLAVPALLPLFYLWLESTPGRAARYGLVYGLGMFGVGISWVYVAIHDFGHSPMPVAALLTFLFVTAAALYPALMGFLARHTAIRWSISPSKQLLLWFPLFWTLGEWFKGWFLTGFPWLSLGYSQIDSPLGGYAPVIGVYGVGLLCAFSAGLLLLMWQHRLRAVAWALPLLLLLWGAGWTLGQIEWTEPEGEPIRVTLIQGNVPQDTKWNPEAVRLRLDRYAELTREHLDASDLIIWPENSITVFYHQLAERYFNPLAEELQESNTDLILGVPLLDEDGVSYYTTMMSLGSHHGFYRKRHLVPFGEFLPLEGLLRGLIDFFNMPMSSFSPGPKQQPLLQAAGQKIAASVCYEDVFPSEMRDFLPEATLLVNGSNNAWYGDSPAPHQHLQISRMRALEFGRPMLRATTNGISAIIRPDGAVEKKSRQFETAIVQATVQPMQGTTPYTRFGNYPVLILIFALLGLGFIFRRR
ncbi:MAG: apolipoprotein N-acyltransferase [Pseudomonadota bacterium]